MYPKTTMLCLLLFGLLMYQPLVLANKPFCSSAAADPDGDGWGWENNQSCIVAGSAADKYKAAASHPACTGNSDPDGDGWGWENGRSCKVGAAPASTQNTAATSDNPVNTPTLQDPVIAGHPQCASADSDPDGDGYGWENQRSCVVGSRAAPAANSGNPITAPTPVTDPSAGIGQSIESPYTPADITDVILVTGQSNVLGSMTSYDEAKDEPHQRVFAWTDRGWQIADLHQVWDRNGHPGNFSRSNSARQPYNNFAFHFGKTLAADNPARVPAIVVASAPGRGIAHWDRDRVFYSVVSDKVNAALAALPHKQSVDGVLWHQGETDWQYEGTSDTKASGFSSQASSEYKTYYAWKLNALISALRSESWGGANTPFICGETRMAEGVNRRLMALNSDSDRYTACVEATDLPARSDDSGGSHFSAVGLRSLGQRYARRYNEMISR